MKVSNNSCFFDTR